MWVAIVGLEPEREGLYTSLAADAAVRHHVVSRPEELLRLRREGAALVVAPANDRLHQLVDHLTRTMRPHPLILADGVLAHKRHVQQAFACDVDDIVTTGETPTAAADRFRALLRQAGAPHDGAARLFRLYPARLEVRLDGKTVPLTRKEFQLTSLLVERANRTLSRNFLLSQLWGSTHSASTRTLDMHVSRIRRKLALDGRGGAVLRTIFGYGYRLEMPEVAAG